MVNSRCTVAVLEHPAVDGGDRDARTRRDRPWRAPDVVGRVPSPSGAVLRVQVLQKATQRHTAARKRLPCAPTGSPSRSLIESPVGDRAKIMRGGSAPVTSIRRNAIAVCLVMSMLLPGKRSRKNAVTIFLTGAPTERGYDCGSLAGNPAVHWRDPCLEFASCSCVSPSPLCCRGRSRRVQPDSERQPELPLDARQRQSVRLPPRTT
jgi:hypothetical protein